MRNQDDYRPVFVVGMNGSGTTMLLDCLNNHPNLFGFRRETKILPNYISSYSNVSLDEDATYFDLFNKITNENIFKIVNGGEAVPFDGNKESLPRTLAATIDYTYKYFALKEGKYRWCDKTPSYALHIYDLFNLFPKAKFIHIVRDGRDCAASLSRRWNYNVEAMIFRWKKVVSEGRRQGQLIGGDNYLEIHYEELTRAPEAQMRNVCSFLNEPYVEAVTHSSRIRKFTGCKETEIVKNAGKSRDILSPRQLLRLEMIAGRHLNQFGYPTEHPDSNSDPSRMALAYWMYFGYARAFVRDIYQDIKQGNYANSRNRLSHLATRIKTRDRI